MKIIITETFYDYFCGQKQYTHIFEGENAVLEAQQFRASQKPFDYGDTFRNFRMMTMSSDESPILFHNPHGFIFGRKPTDEELMYQLSHIYPNVWKHFENYYGDFDADDLFADLEDDNLFETEQFPVLQTTRDGWDVDTVARLIKQCRKNEEVAMYVHDYLVTFFINPAFSSPDHNEYGELIETWLP